MENSEILKQIPLFSDLSREMVTRLSEQSRVRQLPEGQNLFFEGDDGGSLFVVLSGTLSVQRVSESGAVLHIADRGPGEHVGELSLIDDAPRSADVVALTPCRLLVLSRRDFERAVSDSPELALNVMRSLAKRLRDQSEKLTKQVSLDVLGRLCLALIELQRDSVVSLSQKALAERIGATRESVNRSLKQLQDTGAIEVEPRAIKILDAEFIKRRGQPV